MRRRAKRAPRRPDRDFWRRKALAEMTPAEWEALCDGCARCCLIKLEDDDTGEVAYTDLACRLLDDDACRCAQYDIRKSLVKGCVVLTPANIHEVKDWMPATCAYRVLAEGGELADWHPLVSGDPDSVHRAGISVRGLTTPEWEVAEDEWEDRVIEGID